MIEIADIGTRVDYEALRRWTQELPGCRAFLENFFGACGHYPVEVGYLNYTRELGLYSITDKDIRAHASRLLDAFYEITGAAGAELEGRVRKLYESQVFLDGDASQRLKTALRLGQWAAQHACDHYEHDRGARRGCGACRAVLALWDITDTLFRRGGKPLV